MGWFGATALVLTAILLAARAQAATDWSRRSLAAGGICAAAAGFVALALPLGWERAVPAWLALAGLAGAALALRPATGPWVWLAPAGLFALAAVLDSA